MIGQLWEPCPQCGTEPVCANCGYCEGHCQCEQSRRDREHIRAFNQEYPGFLDKVEHHLEGGEREID